MDVFTYADDISLLCLTLSGMVAICGDLTFNATKSQWLYFNCMLVILMLHLTKKGWKDVPYVNKCIQMYLCTNVSTQLYKVNVTDGIITLYKLTNYLLTTVSHNGK